MCLCAAGPLRCCSPCSNYNLGNNQEGLQSHAGNLDLVAIDDFNQRAQVGTLLLQDASKVFKYGPEGLIPLVALLAMRKRALALRSDKERNGVAKGLLEVRQAA